MPELSKMRLIEALPGNRKDIPIFIYKTIASTNDAAKAEREFGIFIAEEQSDGRGTRGKKFYSPRGGIYMSISFAPNGTSHLTLIAAVAVCRALERTCGISPKIKWINDIYLNSRKVGGILCESTFKSNEISKAVVGIGLNIMTNEFPPDLCDIAGAIETDTPREVIIAAIVDEFFKIYETSEDIISEYSERMFLIGKKVIIDNKEVTVKRVENDGALIVGDKSGEQRILNTESIIFKKTTRF